MLEEIDMEKYLLTLIAFIFTSPILAQENLYQITTPYEKARENASKIWVTDYLENATPQEQLIFGWTGLEVLKDKEDDIEQLEAIESVICTYCGLSTIFTPNTWADYQSQQMLTPICKKYAELIAEAKKLKSDEDIEREGKRNLPIRLLKKKCNQAYVKWAEKSEFEKNIEWSNRITSKGNAIFDSICSRYSLGSWVIYGAETAFNNYDAEAESFSLTLTYSSHDKVVSSLTGYCVVKDNPQFAKQFLKDFYAGRIVRFDEDNFTQVMDCEGELMNVNGYIYPKKLIIRDNCKKELAKHTYSFIFPIPDEAQDLVVCNDITGYCFDSQRWKKLSDSLQHITDSLEILKKEVNIKKAKLLDSLELLKGWYSNNRIYEHYDNVYRNILYDKNGYDLMGADTAFTNMATRILSEENGTLQYLFENQSEFYQFFIKNLNQDPVAIFSQLKQESIQRLREKLNESNLTDGSELYNNPSHPLAKEIVSYINAIRFLEGLGYHGRVYRLDYYFKVVYSNESILILDNWADNYKYLRKGIKKSDWKDDCSHVFDFFLEYINGN